MLRAVCGEIAQNQACLTKCSTNPTQFKKLKFWGLQFNQLVCSLLPHLKENKCWMTVCSEFTLLGLIKLQ